MEGAMESSRAAILDDIRTSLGHTPSSSAAPRPPIVPPRVASALDQEIEKLIEEVIALKGNARCVASTDLKIVLADLTQNESIRKAVLWNTERLNQLRVADTLREFGVEIVPHDVDKHAMADADLGITEADFVLPETGTVGLLSSADKPRSVSLLPRVHLVIAHRDALRVDLHQVFAQAKSHNYLVFVTGPSRTADIEMVLTIGVHGPKVYHLWILDD
jgi:L-lactate dehydrogenase complex protein LldG